MATALIIENGELFTPEAAGKKDILCIQGAVVSIGNFEVEALKRLDFEYEVIDAEGCYVIPGLVDPHQHLIGGSGEKGFCSQTPEMTMAEEIEGGITTVVGCIGVDTYTRNMPALLAKAKSFNEEGLSAFVYTGGYDIPPKTLTGSVRTDLILVPEVIGVGEIAISDLRGCHVGLHEIAQAVSDAYVGGLLSGKSGITHFHVGNGPSHLKPIKELLTHFDVRPQSLYPTHVQRTETCLRAAIELSHRGVYCDMDTEDQDLPKWITTILKVKGDLHYFTVSTDASFSSPGTLFAQLNSARLELDLPLEKLLPLFTRNPAHVLGLSKKGKIARGSDADILIVEKDEFRIREVIANGAILMKDGRLSFQPRSLTNSNRKIELYGQKKGFAFR